MMATTATGYDDQFSNTGLDINGVMGPSAYPQVQNATQQYWDNQPMRTADPNSYAPAGAPRSREGVQRNYGNPWDQVQAVAQPSAVGAEMMKPPNPEDLSGLPESVRRYYMDQQSPDGGVGYLGGTKDFYGGGSGPFISETGGKGPMDQLMPIGPVSDGMAATTPQISPANMPPIGSTPPEAAASMSAPQGQGKGGINPQMMQQIGSFLNNQRFNSAPQPQQNSWGNNYRSGFNQPQFNQPQQGWAGSQQGGWGGNSGWGQQQGNSGWGQQQGGGGGKGGWQNQNAATAQPATPSGGDTMNSMAGVSTPNGVTQPTQNGYGGKGGAGGTNAGKGGG